MRLPFEGLIAAAAVQDIPLLISVWGNDFTLFADRDQRLKSLTRSALERADALHCDCDRDLRSAFTHGFSADKPYRVLPGSGGVQTDFYCGVERNRQLLHEFGIPEGRSLVINPRGLRAYVRNDIFFRAIPIVLKYIPEAFFIATGMIGSPVAQRWVRRMGIGSSLRLLPTITREQLAFLFAACDISVSPSSHDGTPNTLLEAMACGCFPITGNVDSIREWIVDGENGLICDESDAKSLAQAIMYVLQNDALRQQARQLNQTLIRARADYGTCMSQAEALYREALTLKSMLASSQS